MKKITAIILIVLILIGGLFILTGCGNSTEPGKQQGKDDNSTIVGYYEAYEAVQYGQKFDEKATKSENITLLVRDDNTATLKWGNSEGKDYKIDGDRFIALAGDEEGKITHKNGKIKIELADGDYLAFKK
jgi:hypothetical protein